MKESTKVLSCPNISEGKNSFSPRFWNAAEEHVSEKRWHCGEIGSLNTVRGQRSSPEFSSLENF